jgi:hypothetical protein
MHKAFLQSPRSKINENLYPIGSQILKSDDFWSAEAQNTVNTFVLTSILTMAERKSAFLKQVRMSRITLTIPKKYKPNNNFFR